MKRRFLHKVLSFCVIVGTCIYINSADAQRYKDRDQQNKDQQEQQSNRDNPDSLKKQSFLNRLTFGGSVDGGLFNGGGFFYLSPRVGYRLTPKLQAGIGLTYLYSSVLIDVGSTVPYRSNTSIYGGSVYTEYNVLQNILSNSDVLFVHLEYEALNTQYYYDPYTFNYKRVWIGNPLVGGGYRLAIGNRAYFNINVLYNLNYANNKKFGSPYTDAWILRLGITI